LSTALLVVGGLFLLVYGPLAVLAWRRPLLARFAWRESTRRRGQFALLVAGLMVGSASITASLVAAESVTQSAISALNQRLGAVDLTVTASGGRSFPLDIAEKLAADRTLGPYVDGVQAGLEVPVSVSDVDQRLGKPGVLMVGFDPAAQKRFGTFVLTDGRRVDGSELNPGDVLLSAALASSLEARAGDHLRLGTSFPGTAMDLRVYGIATPAGPGSYGSYLVIFVTLATAQQVSGESGINLVRVAARGGTPSDLEPARRAAAPLAAAASKMRAEVPLTVTAVRVDAARNLEKASAYILGTTLGVSMLSVLAAIALIVNLMLALADERRPRLAVMRALGLTRVGLVELAILEGAVYSLVAALAGIAVGALIGLFLGSQLWNVALLDPTVQSYLGSSLEATVRPVTLAVAFAAGALVTLGTVAAAAYRTSRLAVALAIRDLPEPGSSPRQGWSRTALLIALAAIALGALVQPDPRIRLLGGSLLIATAGAPLRGRLPDRARATLVGLLLAGWAAAMAAAVEFTSDLGKPLLVLFEAVLLTGVGLGIAASANLKLLDAGVGALGNRFGRLQATLRPPLAYLSRRPVRSGLTANAIALVMVLVTLIAVIVAGAQKPDYARDTAGFDVQVVTTDAGSIHLPTEIENEVTSQMVIPMRAYRGPYSGSAFGGAAPPTFRTLYVLPEQPQLAGPVYLSSREKRFPTDVDVWQAVRTEPGLVVDEWGSGLAPGEEVTLMGRSGELHLHVAAGAGSTILDGLVMSPATVAQIDTLPVGSTILLKLRAGSDPHSVAHRIERALYAQGVQATPTREILDADNASGVGYIVQYDTLLHLGLLVGVLAFAMVLIRATIERRRAIGVLRALGYQRLNVVGGLVIETLINATIGALTGVVAGLLVGYFLIDRIAPGQQFGVDLARLGLALAIVYGTVLIVTGPLASRAARMPPAEAIRITG
jgi:putative ABC transport system permease protein